MTDDAAVVPPEYASDLRNLASRLDELRRSPAYGCFTMVPTSTIEELAERAIALVQTVTQGGK